MDTKTTVRLSALKTLLQGRKRYNANVKPHFLKRLFFLGGEKKVLESWRECQLAAYDMIYQLAATRIMTTNEAETFWRETFDMYLVLAHAAGMEDFWTTLFPYHIKRKGKTV